MSYQEIDEVEPLPAWAGRVGRAGEPPDEGEPGSSLEPVVLVDTRRGSPKRVLAVVLAVIIVSALAGVVVGYLYVTV
jgi:hypothetical protein